jgi:hypothetical protein
MSVKKPAAANTPTTVVADDPDDRKGALKNIGGSQSDHWNNLLANCDAPASHGTCRLFHGGEPTSACHWRNNLGTSKYFVFRWLDGDGDVAARI